MAPILGPDGRPLKRAAGTTPSARRRRRRALCRHRARQPDRALRLSPRTACARGAADRGAARLKRCRTTRSIECLAVAPQGAARRHADRDLRARPRRRRQSHRLSDRRVRARQRSRSSAATISMSATARATPGGDLLVLERRFSWTSGLAMRIRSVPLPRSSPARWSMAGADLCRHGLPDRQHGRPVGASRRRRRAGADADLRRQFFAAAADAAAAVHAGRNDANERGHEAALQSGYVGARLTSSRGSIRQLSRAACFFAIRP